IVEYDESEIMPRARPNFLRQPEKFVMIPANARRRHPLVEERIARLAEYAESLPYNRVELRDRRVGIIASSVAYQYAREVMPEASFLKLGMSYPLPERMIRGFAAQVERLIVVEELDPFFEEIVRSLGLRVEGKRFFPPMGELSLERVEKGFREAGVFRTFYLPAGEARAGQIAAPGGEGVSAGPQDGAERANGESGAEAAHSEESVPMPLRPPVLCPGCPHTAAFFSVKKLGFYRKAEDPSVPLPGQIQGRLRRVGAIVAGDIGCYTLAVLPPLLTMDTAGCMGASIGNAMGIEKAGVPNKVIAVIGDSTFLHSGMTPLLDVVYNGGTITILILDNYTTAMTGHQEHPGTGLSAQGQPARKVDLEKLVRGLGVEDVKVVDAFDLSGVQAAIRDSVERDEPSVVIVRGACAVKARAAGEAYVVDASICNGCSACLRLGCPAIARRDGKARIEPGLCVGPACGVCEQVCPIEAISEPASVGTRQSAPAER
ncbi:MAG: thiamine pyrophosphate-dependent enzyme, partial [Chloroflexota bacterium]